MSNFRGTILTLTIELPDELEAALKAKAQGQGLSAPGYARQLLEKSLREQDDPLFADEARPIWDVLADSMKGVPPEDLAALPKDGASQIDHYLHGSPKR